MSVSCTKPLTIVINSTGDMPLDQAFYEPVRDKIFACRGPFLYQCNATTGAKELEMFVRATAWRSVLCWHPGLNYIFWAGKFDPGQGVSFSGLLISDKQSPVIIDPDTMTEVEQVAADTTNFGDTFGAWSNGTGFQMLFYLDGNVYFSCGHEYVASQSVLFTPFAAPRGFGTLGWFPAGPYTFDQTRVSWGDPISDCCYDPVNDLLWFANGQTGYLGFSDKSSYPPYYTPNDSMDVWNVLGTWPNPRGVCYSTVNNNVYAAQGTRFLIKCLATSPIPGTPVASLVDLGAGHPKANPFRIRYRSSDNKMYVPCFEDNTVAIVDPSAGDSVTWKTGFSCPIDVVFTTTKAFAVQQGSVGLKEIV